MGFFASLKKFFGKMKDRIKQIMESHQMTQKTFSEFINKSQGTISSIFTGRTRPTLDIIEAIKAKFPDVSTEWLLFGTGEMYGSNGTPDAAPSDAGTATPSEQQLNFSDGENSIPQGNQIPQNNFKGKNILQNHFIQEVKYIDKEPRKITEIRIFYDDQTWETFVPKK